MKKSRISQPESVSDFKARIAIMMRERETGKKYSVMGGPRAHESVVRENGYDPNNEEAAKERAAYRAEVPNTCSACGNPARRTADNQGYSACCNKRIS